MRQLDTCDFCGDAPEGVYEVVPASLAGDPKRLALCADCRRTLQSVVDPLLDAANARTAGAERDTASSVAPEPTDQRGGEPTTAEPVDSGTVLDDAIDDASVDATDGVTIQSDEDVVDSDAVGGDEDEEDGDGRDAGVDDATDADAGDGSATDGDAGTPDEPAAGGAPARRPSGYAQVLRLLQNRDEAMPREDLRALATNAYDLGGSEFEAAVDAAVENGDVEETGHGLRTT